VEALGTGDLLIPNFNVATQRASTRIYPLIVCELGRRSIVTGSYREPPAP